MIMIITVTIVYLCHVPSLSNIVLFFRGLEFNMPKSKEFISDSESGSGSDYEKVGYELCFYLFSYKSLIRDLCCEKHMTCLGFFFNSPKLKRRRLRKGLRPLLQRRRVKEMLQKKECFR